MLKTFLKFQKGFMYIFWNYKLSLGVDILAFFWHIMSFGYFSINWAIFLPIFWSPCLHGPLWQQIGYMRKDLLLKIKQIYYWRFSVQTLNITMEHHTLKSVNNCLNANIYSYLETSGGQSSNLYLNVVHFFNTTVN